MGQGPEGTNVLMALNSLTSPIPIHGVQLSSALRLSPSSFVVGGTASSLDLAMGRSIPVGSQCLVLWLSLFLDPGSGTSMAEQDPGCLHGKKQLPGQ